MKTPKRLLVALVAIAIASLAGQSFAAVNIDADNPTIQQAPMVKTSDQAKQNNEVDVAITAEQVAGIGSFEELYSVTNVASSPSATAHGSSTIGVDNQVLAKIIANEATTDTNMKNKALVEKKAHKFNVNPNTVAIISLR